jgi:hypothetical protein
MNQTGPGYDAAGNILGYRVTDSSGITSSYNMTLARFEGYKEAAVSGFRSDSGAPATCLRTSLRSIPKIPTGKSV